MGAMSEYREMAMTQSPGLAISVVDLVKQFEDVTAVDGLSFDVEAGEIFGFLGPNGAGKSTTINILSGVLKPTSGKAIVINVISVSAGFLVLLFSEMVPLQYFGFLVALSMIGSGVGSLTLLPVILILDNRRMKRINSRKK